MMAWLVAYAPARIFHVDVVVAAARLLLSGRFEGPIVRRDKSSSPLLADVLPHVCRVLEKAL